MFDAKWAERFINLSLHVAQWSKDPSTKVGAVIVDDNRRVLGIGYNGFPRGVRDTEDRYQDRSQKYPMVVHAEANAILNANTSVKGCALFASAAPCAECAKLVIQSGIRRVFYPVRMYREETESYSYRWSDSNQHALTMFHEAGVVVLEI